MASYVAAIDQGTTSTRCVLFDRSGRTTGIAQKEHRQSYPRPGWVEHDAQEIWRNTRRVAAAIVGQTSVERSDGSAAGVDD